VPSRLSAIAVGALVAAALAAAAPPPGSTIAPDLRDVLVQHFRFTPTDLADLERGRVVRRALDGAAAGEVAVVGAVRVSAHVETFVARARNIEEFKRGPDILQIGRFSPSPQVDDLRRLTIDRDDLDLRRCRVGSCDIRLPADAIARFQREIDWKAPGADARAGALFKEVLLAHVRAYIGGGPGRIATYEDEKRVVRPIDEFAAILKTSPYVDGLVTGLAEHLLDPAAHLMPGVEEFLYWSKEKFGLTPFITVTHVVMAQAPSGARVIATRDVYSSRYFDASLSYTIADAAAGGPGAFDLVYANRSRAAALKGPFAGLRRAIVERRAKNGLDETLKTLKARLERVGSQ
jgi:hypothetical protein